MDLYRDPRRLSGFSVGKAAWGCNFLFLLLHGGVRRGAFLNCYSLRMFLIFYTSIFPDGFILWSGLGLAAWYYYLLLSSSSSFVEECRGVDFYIYCFRRYLGGSRRSLPGSSPRSGRRVWLLARVGEGVSSALLGLWRGVSLFFSTYGYVDGVSGLSIKVDSSLQVVTDCILYYD